MAYTTIDDPSAYFKVQLYTGTGSGGSDRQITFDDTDTDMQPDLVWIKNRDSAQEHVLVDSVRGATKDLDPSANTLETTTSTRVGSFLSDGFQLGSGTLQNRVNGSSHKMVAWCWKESATPGFDIVTATGNATAKTISHSLSAVPHVMISKEKSGSVNDWTVYHHKNTSSPQTDSLILNETNATSDQNTHWNDTAPTSSVFTVGTGSVVNRSSSTYVYYLFSEKQGFSKFGSYTGNGNANGVFVYTGFRPAFLMVKDYTSTGQWFMRDSKRDTYNPAVKTLYANGYSAEEDAQAWDMLSNGFKMRNTDADLNNASQSYVYIAFAEQPFVNSNGVPCNAR